jgi:hypothetical protein
MTMSNDTSGAVASNAELGAPVEPVTLADVLDALNLFNRPKPSEDDGPWEGGHFIRVDYLPDFINIIAAAWFSPEAVRAAERERCAKLCEGMHPEDGPDTYAWAIRTGWASYAEGPTHEFSRAGRRRLE